MKDSLEEKVELCLLAAEDKKAFDIKILDLKGLSSITDCFFICSGNSIPQVRAIADEIDRKLGKAGINYMNREGYSESQWILLDYNDLVVHIFTEDKRRFYSLVNLWQEATIMYDSTNHS